MSYYPKNKKLIVKIIKMNKFKLIKLFYEQLTIDEPAKILFQRKNQFN